MKIIEALENFKEFLNQTDLTNYYNRYSARERLIYLAKYIDEYRSDSHVKIERKKSEQKTS